ncbi:MAG: hypothetical protein MR766_03700 [Erysipelotrichaceae bacterium]|nr:hypothetical protein [Erysipelotrichaceae bacterium]
MKTKTSYDKKQNVGMIALFIFSITLTAGLTARLTKKANDNASKINQVTDDLTKLANLAKEDKAKLLYQNTEATMFSDYAVVDLPGSALTDYTMIFVNIKVDEGVVNQYLLTKSLFNNTDSENIYFLNGDRCGGSAASGSDSLLFGATVRLSKVDDKLHLEIVEACIGAELYQYDTDTNLYKKGEETFSSGIAVFDIIYGIK